MILGDEFGNFTIWDCSEFLKKLEKMREDKKKKKYELIQTPKKEKSKAIKSPKQ